MLERIKTLITQLNDATKAYDEGKPYMSDCEWDDLYFQLVELEKESGIYLSESPTQTIDYQVVNSLEKVIHNHKMLSLDKTKELSEVVSFCEEEQRVIVMPKMDGLTCSLSYKNGKLVRAETRGNGLEGENILHNALVIPSIPNRIPIKSDITIDGEIICTYKDFEKFSQEYKNPRNFAAGSIRLLDAKECATRSLTFVAWDVIIGFDAKIYLSDCLTQLKSCGFTTVPYIVTTKKLLQNSGEEVIEIIKGFAVEDSYPIDGVVFKFNTRGYRQEETAHHFKNAIAYKFYDETYTTHLKDIEYSMGRTGVLTPIAVFEPIDIDGSTVERASLHNMSILYETLHGLGWKGQQVEVFKANMIIPQIASAEEDIEIPQYTKPYFERPRNCPICGELTHLVSENGTITLMCINDFCEGKLVNKLDHFCGKKGLDIKGLSKATLEKLIDWGWVSNFIDIFHLKDHSNEWIKKPGFGLKSVQNIINAIETSRECELSSFIAALGIPLIGTTASKQLAKEYKTWEDFRKADKFYLLDGFGGEMHSAIMRFDFTEADKLCEYITFKEIEEVETGNSLKGMSIVITGKLNQFKNRAELQSVIEAAGGKVVGSVSKNTSILINNDNTSNSAKNVSATKLGIPVLTEQIFVEKYLTF